jgi:hypothetical protein
LSLSSPQTLSFTRSTGGGIKDIEVVGYALRRPPDVL